jgi:beta-glucanase (GH16 family)
MKAQMAVLAGAVLLFAGLSTVAGAQTWNEDFNGTSVNTGDWNFETGAAANNELEWYQTPNATVSGGILNIQARRENVGGKAYTSSRINTAGKHQFTFGHIEARIQGALGQGYWPAFWMLGANIGSVGWPACGEIDIMETVNATNTEFGTIHWGNPGSTHVSYGVNTGMNFAGFNTFAIDWTSAAITWKLNGATFGSANIANNINNTGAFHAPFFIIINYAIGGDWPGSPNASTVFPTNLKVDYVHVSPVGGSTGPTPTATPASSGGAGTIVNKNSGKCVDAAGASTANDTHVQQYACNGSNAQKWTRTATDSGYVRIGTNNNTNQVIDIAGPSTADGALAHLWAYGGGTNQQWLPVNEGTGYSHLVVRNSGKCLDVPSASTADGVQLQQWACNGSAAQSFKLN